MYVWCIPVHAMPLWLPAQVAILEATSEPIASDGFGEAPLVPGTLTGPSLRGRELVCVSPPSPGGSGETVVVRVTSNGQDFTRGDYRTNIGFTYYEFE